ncbi:unnamed protein product [Allacma fusca]|uniref:Uncharacterized protein n=1 Tax=Allacma fusca TaxID=39272 RepID=A0A8J2NL34_9HEXA|nr:unnamed protein product [Allacma fusca]
MQNLNSLKVHGIPPKPQASNVEESGLFGYFEIFYDSQPQQSQQTCINESQKYFGAFRDSSDCNLMSQETCFPNEIETKAHLISDVNKRRDETFEQVAVQLPLDIFLWSLSRRLNSIQTLGQDRFTISTIIFVVGMSGRNSHVKCSVCSGHASS